MAKGFMASKPRAPKISWKTQNHAVLDVFMATAVRSFTVFLVRLTAAREAWMLFVGAGAGDGRGGVS